MSGLLPPAMVARTGAGSYLALVQLLVPDITQEPFLTDVHGSEDCRDGSLSGCTFLGSEFETLQVQTFLCLPL